MKMVRFLRRLIERLRGPFAWIAAKRSATAARSLHAAGFTQINVLHRGMEQWNEIGLPVEARAAESTATPTAAKV